MSQIRGIGYARGKEGMVWLKYNNMGGVGFVESLKILSETWVKKLHRLLNIWIYISGVWFELKI